MKTTLNLTPRAVKARDRLAERWGQNTTDIVNGALIIADVIAELAPTGRLSIVDEDGQQILVVLP